MYPISGGNMPDGDPLSFSALYRRLLQRVQYRIRSGELTERSLARRAGLSQPHVHNLLKGIRALTTQSGDALLFATGETILDLLKASEFTPLRTENPVTAVTLLAGCAGPGAVWAEGTEPELTVQFPCRVVGEAARPAAVRVTADPQMRFGAGIALVDRSPEQRSSARPESAYLVVWKGEARIRKVRAGAHRIYLVTEENLNCPMEWESVPRPRDETEIILARVCSGSYDQLRAAAISR